MGQSAFHIKHNKSEFPINDKTEKSETLQNRKHEKLTDKAET